MCPVLRQSRSLTLLKKKPFCGKSNTQCAWQKAFLCTASNITTYEWTLYSRQRTHSLPRRQRWCKHWGSLHPTHHPVERNHHSDVIITVPTSPHICDAGNCINPHSNVFFNHYLHSVVKKSARLFETAIFALLTIQPMLRLFDFRRVNVDERLCFGERSQHKGSQPEDTKTKSHVHWQGGIREHSFRATTRGSPHDTYSKALCF